MYDYLIIGSGLFGSIIAHEANKRNKTCLIIEKRNHIGGNCYTEQRDGINIHKYGAHIFHTSNKTVWEYINQFAQFNHYINSPIANYKGEIYNLPFNMNTFNKMWGVITPDEAKAIINKQSLNCQAQNLEEHIISMVGKDIYEKLVKGYTEKQWGRSCTDLPAEIIKRLPIRFTYDNNYFNDMYQGIPIGGYTQIFENLLKNCEIHFNVDYNKTRNEYAKIAKKIIYTGTIDSYFNYCYGSLQYRSVSFETQKLDMPNYQGVAVVNYTDKETPYTRIIEHKHFEFGNQPTTVISKEYPTEWDISKEPYYPINDNLNQNIYNKYLSLAKAELNVTFGGRLGQYKYFDMQHIILEALNYCRKEM